MAQSSSSTPDLIIDEAPIEVDAEEQQQEDIASEAEHSASGTEDQSEDDDLPAGQQVMGFRSRQGTETALVAVVEEARKIVNSGGCAAVVLLDLSAAFDTVNHLPMIQRLREVGVAGTALKWLSSFLADITFAVFEDVATSRQIPLQYGVPQGSSLSPTMFNIYMRPLADLVLPWGVQLVTYADDTQLVVSLSRADADETVINNLSPCLSEVLAWMDFSFLKLNGAKTEIMMLGYNAPINLDPWGPESLGPPPPPKIRIKSLGVWLDPSLGFQVQARKVAATCYGVLRSLWKVLALLPPKARRLLVQTLILSCLDYANAVYLGAPLQSVQNCAARLLIDVPKYSSAKAALQALHWLPVQERIRFKAMSQRGVSRKSIGSTAEAGGVPLHRGASCDWPLPHLGAGMGAWLLCLWLLVCRPVLMLRVTLQDPRKEAAKSSSESGVVSEAIQMLHEVFSIGEAPPNTVPHRKPPQFMVDLFNAVADLDGITKGQGLQQGNVVRSFEDKVHAQDQSYFYFNISSVVKSEIMLKAELRVFKMRQVWRTGRFPRHHFCRADVYELLDSRVKPWRGNLISSRLLPLHSQGWEVFNVTQVVSRWLQNDSPNYGFLIISTLPSGNSLDNHFMSFSRSTPGKGRRTSPFLVLFSDDGRRRATSPPPEPGFPPAPVELPQLQPNQNIVPSVIDLKKIRQIRDLSLSAQHHHTSCQRVPLYVDFEEIGWQGWIISPRGYNAYHCRGACVFPLGQGLGATNHATVQSIAHALKLSKDIDTPCCVPDKLHSINLLYFDDEENVVLKQYDDMVAVSCGCH
ncbi:uncharacterized protein LOC144752493 [Lissotriton helveticus]